ncbi:nuclear pore glycoprotein [Trifolium pratense]|uniref:Nuclear pore glycoprotein n=1 Tax=Trifolium pratense TaxID=57577 RepID=A0A2K3P4K6_TRIPR|nr:nuclear pore glycoprotein [Trifolium pratense]
MRLKAHNTSERGVAHLRVEWNKKDKSCLDSQLGLISISSKVLLLYNSHGENHGVNTSTSTAPAVSSSSTSATQLSSAVVVASSSGTTSTVSTSVVATPKLPSEITGKTVEEIIKEWNAELQERTGKFRKQANAIAEWDRRILQNRDVLLRLEIEVAKVVETQSNLERQLELIETHQQEVDKALQSVEEEAERIYKDERGLLLDDEAASTRDAMYEQSELIERELEQMTEQIKSIIHSLNSNQGGEVEAPDGMTPLDAVVRILNNQLTSLMWIDEKAEEFSSRIQKLANQGSASDRELTGPGLWMS